LKNQQQHHFHIGANGSNWVQLHTTSATLKCNITMEHSEGSIQRIFFNLTINQKWIYCAKAVDMPTSWYLRKDYDENLTARIVKYALEEDKEIIAFPYWVLKALNGILQASLLSKKKAKVWFGRDSIKSNSRAPQQNWNWMCKITSFRW
jgi:hypothetical protein